MKDFIISCVSLTIILAIVLGFASVVVFCSNYLTGWGIPLELTWFFVGFCVHSVNPGKSIIRLSYDVWSFVDKSASRFK